ncbi:MULTISPECIES: I78 family peptidase inhibitor [Sphingomonas]|jgi:hypothetical protein|uniref:I78 family peptidase inhibitor n=1 Tax=Sphingomonas TaxID=13687 RepID=UPI00082EDA04|nr:MULTISPECIES: I78 family peptidase inhibitor [Sphingomonas]MBY0300299.1 hypothetical protein [Sphingomonas ginsenosidimutans]
MMRAVIAVAALPALAACAQQQGGGPASTSPAPGSAVAEVPGAKCDANPAQALIGQRADAVADKAKRLSGARSVRRYVTGAILTMDFRADRLNVETDAGGVIVKLTCG